MLLSIINITAFFGQSKTRAKSLFEQSSCFVIRHPDVSSKRICLTVLLRYNSHVTHFTHWVTTVQWFSGTHTVMLPSPQSSWKRLITPQRSSAPISNHPPLPSPPLGPRSASTDLPAWDAARQRRQRHVSSCVSLHLAWVKIHPRYSFYQCSAPSYCRITLLAQIYHT